MWLREHFFSPSQKRNREVKIHLACARDIYPEARCIYGISAYGGSLQCNVKM